MNYADLHIHSSYSDGTMTPEDIITNAINLGVRVISITDHDSISSQYISNKKYENISIIPGIELSTEFEDLELHILGYFININNKELISIVDNLNKARMERVEKILLKLRNYDIYIEKEDLDIDKNSTIGRSHIAKAMVKKGYFENYKTAFTSYLVKGKPAYISGYKLNYKKVIEVINNAGGIAILAHPGQIYKSLEVERIIKNLRSYGLKGIEVYHPSHTKEQTNNFYNLSKKYKLLITGGSDFHGKEFIKGNMIGSYGINEELLNKLINLTK